MIDLTLCRTYLTRAGLLAACLLMGIVSPPSAQATAPQDETLEQYSDRITEELRAVNEEAATLFQAANSARDGQNLAEAETLYQRVHELQPDFDHAVRRLCGVVADQQRRDEAILLCRKALSLSERQENQAVLLHVLTFVSDQESISTHEYNDAVHLARQLLSNPDLDPDLLPYICGATISLEDLGLLRRCTQRATAWAPLELSTQYFSWVLAMSEQDYQAAGEALEQARLLGLPDESYEQMRETTDAARPLTARFARPALWILGIWAAGLLALLLIGSILSAVVLKAARQPAGSRSGESTGLAGGLRKAYQAILVLGSVYYYLSVPLVLVMVVVLGGSLLYGIFSLGRIPIKLVLIIGIVILVTIWATLKGFFARGQDEDPGQRLDLSAHPRLRRTLDEVAGQIGTRPVDSVYMTPGTELAVMERGGLLGRMRGASERCLILGVGALDGMQLGPFRAILGHEYGHFSNRDTAGGTFALSVRRSISTMAVALAQGGAATWYSPAWIFLNVFHRIFLRISQGASRLQEVMADRWAVFAYGAADFEAGLRHIIKRSVLFDRHTNKTISEVIEQKKPLANLYSYTPSTRPEESEVEAAIQAVIDAAPSPYDSHPSPAARFELVHALDAVAQHTGADRDEEVWDLFEDRASLQRAMTEQVRANLLLNYEIMIPAGEENHGAEPGSESAP